MPHGLELTVELLVPISVNSDLYLAIIDEIMGIKGLWQLTSRTQPRSSSSFARELPMKGFSWFFIKWGTENRRQPHRMIKDKSRYL